MILQNQACTAEGACTCNVDYGSADVAVNGSYKVA